MPRLKIRRTGLDWPINSTLLVPASDGPERLPERLGIPVSMDDNLLLLLLFLYFKYKKRKKKKKEAKLAHVCSGCSGAKTHLAGFVKNMGAGS
jgi:hypothetical protein